MSTSEREALVLFEEAAPGVARIVLNRPGQRNAQNPALLYALNDAFDRASRDESVRCIILAGAGQDFSTGHDLKGSQEKFVEAIDSHGAVSAWSGYREAGAHSFYAIEQEVYLGLTKRWRNLPKPTIAAVQGNCIAAGLMLAWVCDIIVAADDASFSDPVVTFGMPGVEWFGHPYELGPRKAKELLFTSDKWTAEEAHRLGMVNHVVARDALDSFVLAMASKVAAKPAFALKLVKEAVNRCEDMAGKSQAIESLMPLHHLSHQHNNLLFGYMMDPTNVPSMARPPRKASE